MTTALALQIQRGTWEPTTLREAMDYADMLASTDMVPKDYRGKPGNCLVAMQWGREVGLSPLQSLQNIAVIGGRPSLWGDAVLALIMAHPDFVSIREGTRGEGEQEEGYCTITRRGQSPKEHVFSFAQAKAAKLLTKAGPWTEYRSRMLMMRARGFSARDTFPDVLRGIVTAEEARDMRDVPNLDADGAGEADTSPIVAAAGSLRETAAEVLGRPVERPQAPAAEDSLPLVAPDSTLAEIRRSEKTGAPAIVVWAAAAERALRAIGDRAHLADWLRWNEPHFVALSAIYPAEVEAVRERARSRDLHLFGRPFLDAEDAREPAREPPREPAPVDAQAPADAAAAAS